MESLVQILSWFKDGYYVNEDKFKRSWTSFWHKSERLPQSQILGLNDALAEKANKTDVTIGMINKGTVANVGNLPNNAERGDAYYVTSEGYIYQFDGTVWNKTAFTVFPDNVSISNNIGSYPFTLDSSRKYPNLAKSILDIVITKTPDDSYPRLFIEKIRKQNGVINLLQINIEGQTTQILGGDFQKPININGFTYYKLNQYLNSGYEGYVCIDVDALNEGFLFGVDAYLLHEIYNKNYPSLYRQLLVEDSYVSADFVYDRENDAALQKSLLNDNPLSDYVTSNRCIIEGITDLDYTLSNITKDKFKEEFNIDDDVKIKYPLPVDNITKLTVNVGAINRTHFFTTAFQKKGNFAVSYWFSKNIENGVQANANRSIRLNWIKGMNDRVVKSIDASFVVSVIESQIAANGFYQAETDSYILRCNGKFNFGDVDFYNISVQTKNVPDDLVFDNVQVSVGSGGAFTQNKTTVIYYTGFELSDKLSVYTSNNFREYLKGYAPQFSIINQAVIRAKQLTDCTYTYSQHNQIIDLLDKARVFSWVFDGGYRANTGSINLYEGESIEKISHPKFGNGYKIKSDTLLPVYGEGGNYNKMLLRYQSPKDVLLENYTKEIFGFWIDRRELKGNSLCFTSNTGGTWTLRQSDLVIPGYVETRVQTDVEPYRKEVEVVAVDGHYSYVVVRSLADGNGGHWLFNIILLGNTNLIDPNGEGVKELTLYNPTSLYNCDDINPYHIYLSESQKNNSPLRGKTVLIMGDSQQNDNAIGLAIARKLGVNIIHAPLGGHRMKYNNNTSAPPYNSWMYHWEARKRVFAVKADYYFLMVSSNDSSGGGDLSTVATQRVIDNYPVYGDDEATVTAKLALFNAMAESTVKNILGVTDDLPTSINADTPKYIYPKMVNPAVGASELHYFRYINSSWTDLGIDKPLVKDEVFDYKQTYSAYIKQINTTYPDAKVVLATIPISTHNATDNGEWVEGQNADKQRDLMQNVFVSIRKDIFELSEKHSTGICDLFKEGGINWENFPTKVSGVDSVHWTTDAKKQFFNPVIQAILK